MCKISEMATFKTQLQKPMEFSKVKAL